jgi:hypothetical protein
MTPTITTRARKQIVKHPSILFNTITLLVVIAGWIFILGARAADMKSIKTRVDELEAGWKADHDLVIEMRADVKWIRQAIERAH